MQKPVPDDSDSAQTRADHLPFLPSEVWFVIFEFALQSDLRASRNIQLVCRLWHTLLCFDLMRAKNKVLLISDTIHHTLLFELEQKARLKRRSLAPRARGNVRLCLFTIANHIDYVDASPLALNQQTCHDVQQSVQETFLHQYRPNAFERTFFQFEYFKTLTARLGQMFFKLALPQERFEKYELISRHTPVNLGLWFFWAAQCAHTFKRASFVYQVFRDALKFSQHQNTHWHCETPFNNLVTLIDTRVNYYRQKLIEDVQREPQSSPYRPFLEQLLLDLELSPRRRHAHSEPSSPKGNHSPHLL